MRANQNLNMSLLPKIIKLTKKKLVGKKQKMSLANNKTMELWKSFMIRRKEIINNFNKEMISMQVYNESLRIGDLKQEFEKWAVVEVSDFDKVPNKMETFVLESGLYAVFHYRGLNTDNRIFIHIFGNWLPNSDYLLDNRPHFEILGEKYKNGDPNSEEEIWIPIKEKNN
jgi:AraC family transcriptional regulator